MVLRQSASYMAANIVVAILGFIAVFALTRLVAPAAYGEYIVAVATANVVAITSFTWLRHAILRFQSAEGADVRMAVLAGYASTLLVYPLIFAGLIWFAGRTLQEALIALIFAAALCFFELGQELLRARQSVFVYVTRTVTRSVLALTGALLVAWSGGSGLALALAMAGGYTAGALLFANRLWAAPRAPFDRIDLLKLARYGLPITISGIFVALSTTLDRFVLDEMLGAQAAGLYGAAADFVRQCAIIPAVSASLAIAPLAVSTLGQRGGETTARHLGDGLELLLAVLLPAAIGLGIVAPHIANVMLGEAYRTAATAIIPILALAFLMHMLSQQYVQLSFSLADRPSLYALHTGGILLANALLIAPLIRLYDLPGAALSFLIAEMFGVVLGLLMSTRTYRLPLIPGRALRVLVATAGMAMVAWFLRVVVDRTDLIGLFAIVLPAMASYLILLVALDVFDARRRLSGLIARRNMRKRAAQ